MKKILYLASFMLIAIFACSSVYAADMTASGLLATVDSNKTITLTDDVTLTSTLTVPADVEVIDLGGKTLNLKAGIVVKNSLEIKNGIITRDATFTAGSMIRVTGATTNFILTGVTLDGKKVEVPTGQSGIALAVDGVLSATLKDNCKIINHAATSTGDGGIVGFKKTETVDIMNTQISDNTAKFIGILKINECGNFTFYKDSVVKGNEAPEASGIHIQNSDAIVAGTIEGNKTNGAGGNGAGLYVFLTAALNDSGELKVVTIAETAKIINNISNAAGGGVYVTGPKDVNVETGHVTMLGGLISGNIAKGTPAEGTLKDGGGAGIYVARGNMLIEGGKIEGNTSASGVGDAILVSHQGGNPKTGNLAIVGGLIDGKVKVSDTQATAIVQGGAFTDDVSAYLDDDIAIKEVDGVKYVGVELEITVKAGLNGKATVAEKAVEGQPVKITVTPNKNYEVASLKVTDASGAAVTVKDNTFTMPDSDVTVEVTFKEMKKDGTPATGSMNVVMVVSAVLSVVTLGVLVSKKYAKNN